MKKTFFSLTPLFLVALIYSQENSSGDSALVKYYKTNLSREKLLKDEITEEVAKTNNHIKATYSPQGDLVNVEFIPAPPKKEERKEIVPRARGPFRYFKEWKPFGKKLSGEIKEVKADDGPYYRVSYEEDQISLVEFFQNKSRHLWTFLPQKEAESEESTVTIVFASNTPLTSYDPNLFHSSLSEMRRGWKLELEFNRLGRPIEAHVFNTKDLPMYYYTITYTYHKLESDPKQKKEYLTITSTYYRSSAEEEGSHILTFSPDKRLVRTEEFDKQKKLVESTEYLLNQVTKEVIVLVRDGSGKILSSHKKD